jgi:hypothetical protein
MRFLFIILVAVAIAGVTYPFTGDFSLFADAALWIYSLVAAFLIDKAIARRRELKASVNVELARLRHIYHVAEELPRPFQKKVAALLLAYERRIAGEFTSHHASTDAFRALSHAIYSFSPRTKKDGILYADLLNTLQDLTLGRQKIQVELMGGLYAYDWFLLLIILAGLLTLLFFPVDNLAPFARLALSFVTVLVVLIPMEMLWKGDHYEADAIRKYQDAYASTTTSK